MRALIFMIAALAPQTAGFAQTPAAPSWAFEVASVKPSPPSDLHVWSITGGPGTRTPGQFSCANAPLRAILLRAYDIPSYRLAGPASLDDDKFDIVAKIPEGTTKEQVTLMLRNLIVERFGLVTHVETRELVSYDLVVAKRGLKMKAAEKGPSARQVEGQIVPSAISPSQTSPGPDGAPILPPGKPMWISSNQDGGTRITARMQTLSALTEMLAKAAGRPVADKTGLTGTYDFNLFYAPDSRVLPPPPPPPPPIGGLPSPPPPSGDSLSAAAGGMPTARDPIPDLPAAIEAQLGLKLQPAKAPGSVLVIDRYSRVPSAN